MPHRAIMRIVPAIQATQLAGENLKIVKKKDIKTEDIVDVGVKNLVGTSLIQAEANLIGHL